MTVVAKPADTDGAILDTKISALGTAVTAAPAGSIQLQRLTEAQQQAQREAVHHYLANGRILPGTVISTLSLTAPASDNPIGSNVTFGAQGPNLKNRLSALTTSAAIAGFQQSTNAQLLLQAQHELVLNWMAADPAHAATILSTLS